MWQTLSQIFTVFILKEMASGMITNIVRGDMERVSYYEEMNTNIIYKALTMRWTRI